MRTTFTEEQVQILQANFQIDSNPDGQDLERIAQITGLSKRVTQVFILYTPGGFVWGDRPFHLVNGPRRSGRVTSMMMPRPFPSISR